MATSNGNKMGNLTSPCEH